MATLSVPRILLAGASSSVGKSVITLGLVYELRRRGLSVSVCTTNSNIALALIYRRIAGRYVRCIDPRLLSPSQILDSLYQASVGADVVIIDGSGGLYDGSSPGLLDNSDAEIAALTRTPTVLVIDGRRVGTTAAATMKGALYYAQGFEVAGALLNRVHDDENAVFGELRDRKYFEEVMISMRLPKLLGGVAEAPFDIPDLPRVVSEEFNFGALPRHFFVGLNSLINKGLDINSLLAVARSAPALQVADGLELAAERKCRIAVTDDVCFGLCYQDNLDLLRYLGAELVSFSPLADRNLPEDINGLYLTGGYLDEYGDDLAANAEVMAQVAAFASSGGVLYAEGAGLAYLSERIKHSSSEAQFRGCGVIKAGIEPQQESQQYCDTVTVDESVLGGSGLVAKGICTNRWKFAQEFPILKTMQVGRLGQRSVADGFSPTFNSLATLCFWNWASNPEFAQCFVEAARLSKKSET